MKLKQIQEAKYYNTNAAVWVQNAVDREFDMYERTGSWPQVVQKIGHQEFKFDHSKALADLTKEYGTPDTDPHSLAGPSFGADPHDEHENEGVYWQVGPTIAYSETDQDDYKTLDVGLADDGTVSIWDVTDA